MWQAGRSLFFFGFLVFGLPGPIITTTVSEAYLLQVRRLSCRLDGASNNIITHMQEENRGLETHNGTLEYIPWDGAPCHLWPPLLLRDGYTSSDLRL